MTSIDILIVDDTVVVRRLLARMLDDEPDVTVVGTARNGEQGLQLIDAKSPSVVILDIEMPGMGGLETLSRIREAHGALPVIMFSTLTERGAGATMEALLRGATDYATKPTGTVNLQQSYDQIRRDLLPKIRAVGTRPPGRSLRHGHPGPHPPAVRPAPRSRPGPTELLVIGTSTGGPEALSTLVPNLDVPPVPVVIVQHMPPMFTRLLAERLDKRSALTVREAQGGERLVPGEAWIAPGDRHIEVRRHRGSGELELRATLDPPENSCRPAVDVLFRTAARACGDGVLGLVMTGMGRDGERGARQIVEAGGTVLVQDEATSVVWGMPKSVVESGAATCVLPLDELAPAVRSRINETTRDREDGRRIVGVHDDRGTA